MSLPDKARARDAILEFLRAIGRDPATEPELGDTPQRVADAYADELCAGYGVDVSSYLSAHVTPGETDLVIVRGVPVTTTCPHHLMPGIGTASVGFAPAGRLMGLGALARVVDVYARRLTLQETLGENIVTALFDALSPRWVACRLVLQHACVVARGERAHESRLETFAFRGEGAEEARRLLGVGT